MLIGIPLGRFLAWMAIETQATETMQLPMVMEPSNYLMVRRTNCEFNGS